MKRRELNISNKTLHENTSEDIIIRSPLRIPPRELQSLSDLKSSNITYYAFYDIAKTEKQAINWQDVGFLETFGNFVNLDISSELDLYLGDFNDT